MAMLLWLNAKNAALRRLDFDRDLVAGREVLTRMGLYPKRRTGVEACVIFADVAQKRALADRGVRAVTCGTEPDVLRADRDLDVVAGPDGIGERQLQPQPAGRLDRAATGDLPRHQIDQAHEVRDQA